MRMLRKMSKKYFKKSFLVTENVRCSNVGLLTNKAKVMKKKDLTMIDHKNNDKTETTVIGCRLSKEMRHRLKVKCVKEGLTMQTVLENLVENYLNEAE